MKNNPIAFFDSGIGGSTILKDVIKKLPNEKYIYFPDSENNPYGNKSREELFIIVDNVVRKLLEYKPKLIVCACNTATAMVLDDIRCKYPNVIFVGTEPAVKVAFDNHYDKKTIVLTTKGTGDSEKFNKLFKTYKPSNCTLVEAPLLAGLIENNLDVSGYLNTLLEEHKGCEVVVLGCTHFPIVEDEIRQILGDVTFIHGGFGIANRVNYLLKENDLIGNESFELNILADDDIKNRICSILKAQ